MGRTGRPPIEPGQRVVSRSVTLRRRDDETISIVMRERRDMSSRSEVVRAALELLRRTIRG